MMSETNIIAVNSAGFLTWQGKTYRCALGKTGVTSHKQEGDGATPLGRYPLRGLLYRADREARPQTNLPLAALTPTDGWCDDLSHSDYNKHVTLPHRGRCEELWREDSVYDLIIILGYNDHPVQPGNGSAIFMHIAKPDYSPTEGCVAVKRADLLEILAGLTPDSHIEIAEK